MSRTCVARGWTQTVVHRTAALAVAIIAVSCGVPQETASSDPSMVAAITAELEGVQLDVWGGGEPAPGGTTSMFVHHGDRAAEVYWTSDGWCLARVYTWSLRHVLSDRTFDIHYEMDDQFLDCVMGGSDALDLRVFDVQHSADGATTYQGAYADTWTVRTKCTTTWNAAAPCGFHEAAAVVPEM